ncbi:transporter substrate-binding domain-containing protein [Marivivens donghaensis]|uniref:Transporter substrate-binding domain-containing protein n=2 Tax=Marivivens donghaensis TaxID=1699413 RepID=A0ABX0W0Y5_9RHOB|nr:transporter substrate-binding domain-containing protein [Marivivens donghaensis]
MRLRNALMFSRLKLAQNLQGRDLGYYIRHFDGSLGVIQNSSFATFARTDFPDANIVAYPTWEQVVEATTYGDVDAAYGDEFEIRRITVDHPETSISLRTVAITDAQDAISVVVPWDAPRLLAIVNQVIDNQPEAMTADDVNDLYRLSVETEGGH